MYYIDKDGNPQTWKSGGETDELTIEGTTEEIEAFINSLSIKAPPESDADFVITFGVTTDPDIADNYMEFDFPVMVLPVADPSTVHVENVTIPESFDDESTGVPLVIVYEDSVDHDGSQTASLVITVPSDENGPYGTIVNTDIDNDRVTFTDLGGGVYTVNVTGDTAAEREEILNRFLDGGLEFVPRPNLAVDLVGEGGIKVEAISTEEGNGDTAADVAYISVFVTNNMFNVTLSGESTIAEDIRYDLGADVSLSYTTQISKIVLKGVQLDRRSH